MDITHLLLNALCISEDKTKIFLNSKLKYVKIILIQNNILFVVFFS